MLPKYNIIQSTTLGALNMKQYQDLDQFQYSLPFFVHFLKTGLKLVNYKL